MFEYIKSNIKYIAGLPQERKIRKLTNYSIGEKYKRIYLYHVRKGAGKSITDMIMATEGKDHYNQKGKLFKSFNKRIIFNDKVFVGWNLKLIQNGHYYYGFSHHPYHKVNLPPDTFTFTCLRDPVNRVVSHYNMLKRWETQNNLLGAQEKETKLLGLSFSDYLNNISKNSLLNQLYMFSENYSIAEAVDRIQGLSYFFFVEDFEDGIRILGEKLGLKLKVLHTDRSKTIEADIPNGATKKLRELLAPEYDLIDRLKK